MENTQHTLLECINSDERIKEAAAISRPVSSPQNMSFSGFYNE
jgi:hypothetical protein